MTRRETPRFRLKRLVMSLVEQGAVPRMHSVFVLCVCVCLSLPAPPLSLSISILSPFGF